MNFGANKGGYCLIEAYSADKNYKLLIYLFIKNKITAFYA